MKVKTSQNPVTRFARFADDGWTAERLYTHEIGQPSREDEFIAFFVAPDGDLFAICAALEDGKLTPDQVSGCEGYLDWSRRKRRKA